MRNANGLIASALEDYKKRGIYALGARATLEVALWDLTDGRPTIHAQPPEDLSVESMLLSALLANTDKKKSGFVQAAMYKISNDIAKEKD